MARSLALIGAGGIGGYHLASMQKLAKNGHARLVAIVEPRRDYFVELRRDLEVKGVHWYTDYHELLREETHLDAVTIATPIPLHYEMTLACLQRDLYVNLEKPPVPLVQQLNELIDLDRLRRVAVGFQMILSRNIQRLKQLIVEGTIGEVLRISARGCWPRLDSYYRRTNWAGKLTCDGQPVFDGPATNALAHLVHNVMFLAGGPTVDRFAVPTEVEGELYRARPIESYDVACLRGSFPSGTEFSLAVTHATQEPLPFKLEVHGTRGWLRLSEDGARFETSAGENVFAPESTQHLLDLCHEQFIDVINGRAPRTHTSLRDTTGYVRATNALLLSSGGIHDIPHAWINRYEQDGEGGFDVRGLRQAVERVCDDGRLFSEQDLDWAQASPSLVRLDSFQTLDLNSPLALTPL